MISRWIIRTFSLFLLLLSTAGWLWSHTHTTSLGYVTPTRDAGAAVTVRKSTVYLWSPLGFQDPGWHFQSYVTPESQGHILDYNAYRVLGFAIRHPDTFQHLGIPFWFLTVASLALSLLAWRATGPRRPGRAFPVEIATEGAKHD